MFWPDQRIYAWDSLLKARALAFNKEYQSLQEE